jgi:hypothetical protein
MSFKLILKEVTYAHTVRRNTAKHFVETSFLMEIDLFFGGNHLPTGCSTVFLLPYWGAAPFSSPPSVRWLHLPRHGLCGDVLPEGGVPKF